MLVITCGLSWKLLAGVHTQEAWCAVWSEKHGHFDSAIADCVTATQAACFSSCIWVMIKRRQTLSSWFSNFMYGRTLVISLQACWYHNPCQHCQRSLPSLLSTTRVTSLLLLQLVLVPGFTSSRRLPRTQHRRESSFHVDQDRLPSSHLQRLRPYHHSTDVVTATYPHRTVLVTVVLMLECVWPWMPCVRVYMLWCTPVLIVLSPHGKCCVSLCVFDRMLDTVQLSTPVTPDLS